MRANLSAFLISPILKLTNDTFQLFEITCRHWNHENFPSWGNPDGSIIRNVFIFSCS